MRKNLALLAIAIAVFTVKFYSQATNSAIDLKSSRLMYQNILKNIKDDIKEKYFDSKFGGIDIDGNAKTASDLITPIR